VQRVASRLDEFKDCETLEEARLVGDSPVSVIKSPRWQKNCKNGNSCVACETEIHTLDPSKGLQLQEARLHDDKFGWPPGPLHFFPNLSKVGCAELATL